MIFVFDPTKIQFEKLTNFFILKIRFFNPKLYYFDSIKVIFSSSKITLYDSCRAKKKFSYSF